MSFGPLREAEVDDSDLVSCLYLNLGKYVCCKANDI